MKKKIIVIVSILFVIIASWLIFLYLKEYNNNVYLQIGKDKFRYTYWELFSGNEWRSYVNDHYVSFVEPFEGLSKKEMKEHLSKEQLIKCLFDEENIRIYSLPWTQYESKYKIIYTIDGERFYSFDYDAERYKKDPEIKQRLDQLYIKYPKEELEKREQESWE